MVCWFAFKILSPSAGPAHWKSWNGVEASVMLEPERNTCQRRTNIFHSSIDTPISSLGRSSFGPRDAGLTVGGGGDRGVTISRFPYPGLLPPVPFCPFVSRLPPFIVFLPLSCKSHCLTPYSDSIRSALALSKIKNCVVIPTLRQTPTLALL